MGVSKTVLVTPFLIPWRFNEVGGESVAADEPCEAAFGCEAVLKSVSSVYQAHRVYRFRDRFAFDRSLVLLVSGYMRYTLDGGRNL